MGFGNGSLSLSGSRNKLESDYLSVQEQTGLFAGEGGFDITVGKHTQLDGAVIASQADADKNRLDTDTLGFSDIRNHAEFKVEQQSVGFNTGGDIAGNFLTNASSALINGSGNSGKSDNTTHAAVSQGEITVRDTTNQQQNVDDLSRDTDHAHQKLDTIFDKEKEQKRFAQAQLIAELAQQVTDIAFTEAKIAATQHANDTFNPTEEQRTEAEKTLGTSGKNSDSAAVDAYLKAQAVQDYLNTSGWGTGGDNRRLVQAGTALIQGLVSGNITAAVANASAPYLANEIGKQIDSKEGKLAAHAIANVALALVKGENAAVQASGALTAEAIGMLSEKLYGKSADKLTEEEKSTTSAFASLAAGIAGALVGDSTQSATSAAQAGKVTIENNSLGSVLAAANANKPGTISQWQADKQAEIGKACSGGTPVSCQTMVAAAGTLLTGPLTSGAALTAGGIGAGANAGIQYLVNGSVDPNDVILGYWTGVATAGAGFWGTVTVNSMSGATSSYIKGDDPLKGGVINGAASGVGYGVGKLIQGPMNSVINPNWKNYEWVDIGLGISKPLPLNPLPSISGNIGSSIGSEGSNVFIQEQLKSKQEEKK